MLDLVENPEDRFSHNEAHTLVQKQVCQCQPRVIIYKNCVEFEFIILHAKFHDHRTNSSVEKDFNDFYHIRAWRPCDLNHLYKLSFPLPKEAPHEIWL